jgi:hypothetical protein
MALRGGVIQRYVAFHMACSLVLMPRRMLNQFAIHVLGPVLMTQCRESAVCSDSFLPVALFGIANSTPFISGCFLIHNIKKVLLSEDRSIAQVGF